MKQAASPDGLMGKLAWALFAAALIVCMVRKVSVLYALLAGLVLFPACALRQGYKPGQVARLLWLGVQKAGTVHVMFLLIGMLTALWRASGTMPYLVGLGLQVIRPQLFFPCVFLVCCAMSMLTGTCFGTVGTIGTICMMMARAGAISPEVTAGAVMSGAFFGDRMSPMSSTAHLVCGMTKTNIYDNIRRMLPTTILPFTLTAAAYLALSRGIPSQVEQGAFGEELAGAFSLTPIVLLPAAVLLLLCLLRINVKWTMLGSIGTSALLCVVCQGMPLPDLAATALQGYRSGESQAVAAMVDGGGVASMMGAMAIVLVSSSYYSVLAETGLLSGLTRLVGLGADKLERFTVLAVTGVVLSAFSCSQSLAIMLTCQLCEGMYPDRSALAHDLEDSLGTIPPLIPWCVASAVPMATLGAGPGCLLYAFFLYLTPLCRVATTTAMKVRRQPQPGSAG